MCSVLVFMLASRQFLQLALATFYQKGVQSRFKFWQRYFLINADFLSSNGILNYRVSFIKQLHGFRILGYYKKWMMTSG